MSGKIKHSGTIFSHQDYKLVNQVTDKLHVQERQLVSEIFRNRWKYNDPLERINNGLRQPAWLI